MAQAKRRDEWDRWSRLLALVDVRTNFGENVQPIRPLDLWPPELVTAAHRAAERRATDSAKLPIAMKDLAQIILHARPRTG